MIRMGSRRVWVLILLLWCAVCVSMEEDIFIDPHDMVNPRRKILKEEGETPEEEKTLKINPKLPDIQPSISEDNTLLPDIENMKKPADVKQDTPKECPNTDIGKRLLRSYVKSLLKHFELKGHSSGSQEYNMLLQLSDHDFEILQKFVSEESKDLHTLHESAAILTAMIRSVSRSRSHLGTIEKIFIWFEETYGASIDAALKEYSSVRDSLSCQHLQELWIKKDCIRKTRNLRRRNRNDPQGVLGDQCVEKDVKCQELKDILDKCNERVAVNPAIEEETCVEELIDFVHCVEHCVSKSLFSKLV